MEFKLRESEINQKTATVMILVEPELMDGERFELRIKFSFDPTRMVGAELSKHVGQSGQTRSANLDPIDFKFAIGCLRNEEKHLSEKPGFRTYRDLADPERSFLIDTRVAVKLISEQERMYGFERNAVDRVRVNRPDSGVNLPQQRADPLGEIDALLAQADSFRSWVTNPEPPMHR